MKFRKKMTAILLTAIFMISTLAVLVNAELYDAKQEGGLGTVELVDTVFHSATHSAKLIIPADAQYDDEARVVFTYGEDLNSLDSVSYWGLIEARNTAGGDGDFEPTPYVTFSIDYDDDDAADAWGVAWVPWEGIWGTPDTNWHTETFDDDSLVAVSGLKSGQGTWPIAQPGITLSALKAMVATEGEAETFGDYTILEIKVGIGNWGPYTPPSTVMIAYVDDVTINGETYDLEPSPTPTQTRADALRAKGVPGKGEGIDEAPGLGKPLPNENFAARERKGHAHGHAYGHNK